MTETLARYRVWDLPSRLSHWAIAILVIVQFASGLFELLPMSAHIWCGYALLVVVLFRILWGFFGSQSARFVNFLQGPGAVLRYGRTLLSEAPSRWPGHNPLGGWSVVLLLALTLVQAITGLFTGHAGEPAGPLALTADHDLAHALHDLHESLFWFLLLLVVLHIAAGLFYLLHKNENLIGPMFGDGRLPLTTDPRLSFAGMGRAVLLFAFCVAAVAIVVLMGGES